jgi:hypothetical protein
MSETIPLSSEAAFAVPPIERKPVRSLVQLGFWAPSMAFLRRCKEAGIQLHLLRLGLENKKASPTSALTSEGGVVLWSEVGVEAGLKRIVEFTRHVNADALCTNDELSLFWLAQNRDLFEPVCRLMVSPAESIERLLEKSEQTKLAQQAGFHVLQSWLLQTIADSDQIPEGAFPICLRPTRINTVHPGFKARKINSRAEIGSFLSSLQWSSPLLAQPYCIGPNIVLHSVRSLSGEILQTESFLAYRKYRGFALSIQRIKTPDPLRDAAMRFAELANINGPFHFDLLKDASTGEIYFLEINCRMGGTTAKAVKLGYDEPMLALAAYGLIPPHPPQPLKQRTRVTGKRALVAQVLSMLKQGPGDMDFPRHSRWRTAATALRELTTVPDALVSWQDMQGTLHYLRYGGGT